MLFLLRISNIWLPSDNEHCIPQTEQDGVTAAFWACISKIPGSNLDKATGYTEVSLSLQNNVGKLPRQPASKPLVLAKLLY